MLDRLIQQAIVGVLTPIFDPTFSDSSFGFCPKRSAHGAVKQVQQIIRQGYAHCIDVDLSKFFDRCGHDVLMSRVSRKVRDRRLLRLIGRYLRAGVMVEGVLQPTEEDAPQGGPLSPLLSNVLLDDLDQELERRGLRFVRYADDFQVFVCSDVAHGQVVPRIGIRIRPASRFPAQFNAQSIPLLPEPDRLQYGTRKEFRDAVQGWKERKSPWITFYLDDAPTIFREPQEVPQYLQVCEFRKELEDNGIVCGYKGVRGHKTGFYEQVSDHLRMIAGRLFRLQGGPRVDVASAKPIVPSEYTEWLLGRCGEVELMGLEIKHGSRGPDMASPFRGKNGDLLSSLASN